MFPPSNWNYNKIIAGSEESKYDFKYIAEFNFEIWMKKLKMEDFISINIDNYCEILCEKHVLYVETGSINLDNLSELRDIINEYSIKDKFMRLSYRSAKDTFEGRLPIKNVDQILTAIIKSERCFDDMIAHIFNKCKKLYVNLIPFRECRQERELRCFIFEKKLVAITNQFPDDVWPFRGVEILIIQRIKEFVDSLWSQYDLYDSVVADIEMSEELTPYLIEFNPYGTKGSTSAILFDWNKDINVLFSKKKEIVLKYTRDKTKDIII